MSLQLNIGGLRVARQIGQGNAGLRFRNALLRQNLWLMQFRIIPLQELLLLLL